VQEAYDWGRGELADWTGPDPTQTKILQTIRDEIGLRRAGVVTGPIQIAAASGHGIGKTCLIGWLIDWFTKTHPHPQVITTANTKEQLSNKTWRELAKWHLRSLTRDMFQHTATKFYNKKNPKTWFATAVPWSKERSEAFAGTHEDYVLMVFDEASLIDNMIWEVAEGAMVSGKLLIWIVFGNPTRNSGRFFECFNRFKHRWTTFQIDSRNSDVAMRNSKEKIQQWIEDYGEDSDFVKVRVRGMFPSAGSLQFIPTEIVQRARKLLRAEREIHDQPKIIGVDVARFGDDQTVIVKRQGLQVREIKRYRELDTMQVAQIVAQEIELWEPDGTFVDVGNMGAGVVDRLRQLGHNIFEVNFGSRPADSITYANKRAEMWGRMRDWLKSGGAIPDDEDLCGELTAVEYDFNIKEQILLEKKKDMKDRGLASPDAADALAVTFAEKVITRKDREFSDRLAQVKKALNQADERKAYKWRNPLSRR